jgi:16S rRNA (guanine1516-N2)-methyltransferase
VIPLAVTVSARAGQRLSSVARAQAAAWGLPWLDRPEQGGLAPLLVDQVAALLILGGEGWVLRDREGGVGFSPGLATVRIKRLDPARRTAGAGEPGALNQADDQLVRLGQLGPGDVVFDATLGLAADALVCARAVGASGRVIGVEASLPLFLLVKEGLARMRPFSKSCAIEPRLGRAEALLAELPDGSVDCVLFDPMFDRPRRASQAFDVLRRFALHEPLTEKTLFEARRVARRWVVVKVGRYGNELKRLKLEAVPQTRAGPLVWARVAPLGSGSVGGAERGVGQLLGAPPS